MSPTYSPIASMGNMGATLNVGDLSQHEVLEAGAFKIRHADLRNGPHDIVGYRLEAGDRSLCYVAEISHPKDGLDPAVVELARGADVLIHEAYYTNEELAGPRPRLAGPHGPQALGHASFRQATDVAIAAGVKRLHYFYHHPDHSDATINAAVEIERKYLAEKGVTLRVDAAREGLEFEV